MASDETTLGVHVNWTCDLRNVIQYSHVPPGRRVGGGGGGGGRTSEELLFTQRFETDTSRIRPGRFATEWQCKDRFVDVTLHL